MVDAAGEATGEAAGETSLLARLIETQERIEARLYRIEKQANEGSFNKRTSGRGSLEGSPRRQEALKHVEEWQQGRCSPVPQRRRRNSDSMCHAAAMAAAVSAPILRQHAPSLTEPMGPQALSIRGPPTGYVSRPPHSTSSPKRVDHGTERDDGEREPMGQQALSIRRPPHRNRAKSKEIQQPETGGASRRSREQLEETCAILDGATPHRTRQRSKEVPQPETAGASPFEVRRHSRSPGKEETDTSVSATPAQLRRGRLPRKSKEELDYEISAATLDERLARARAQPTAAAQPEAHAPSTLSHARAGAWSAGDDTEGDVQDVLDPHRFHEPVPSYVLHPDAKWRVGWNVVVGVAALWSTVAMPLNLAFYTVGRSDQLLLLLTDMLFGIDLVLAFFTSYHDAAKQPVTSPRLIRRRALLIDLVPGLCSSLPFELLDAIFTPNRNPLVVLKILRVVKLGGAKRSLADAGAHPGLLRLLQMSLLYLLIVHLASCVYWAVATREEGTTLDDLGCDPAVSPLVESWGVCPELRDAATPLTDKYFHSFYLAAAMMKGSNYPSPLETPSKGATAYRAPWASRALLVPRP